MISSDCLSITLFQIKKAVPPLSLHGQLLWREFFYCAATKNPNFDRMQGNPICVQIPWDKNMEALAKWANVSDFFRRRKSICFAVLFRQRNQIINSDGEKKCYNNHFDEFTRLLITRRNII